MIKISRLFKRSRITLVVVILVVVALIYNSIGPGDAVRESTQAVHETPQDDDGILAAELLSDKDLSEAKILPELGAELEAKVQAEVEDPEVDISKQLNKDMRHAAGTVVKHVPDGEDMLLDSQYDSLPILYNRIGHGKLTGNVIDREANDAGHRTIPRDYRFQNPITASRQLGTTQKTLHLMQAQRLSAQEKRHVKVKELFHENWNQYFYFSKRFDSFRPLTLQGVDDYIGWSVTLVDSLDTLFLMGFAAEFEMAVAEVDKIDFYTVKTRDDIPIFEANIRVLGGLLGAFDLSGDWRLLDKAKDVAKILLRSFDTVNHMPIMYYNLKAGQRDHRRKYASMTNYLSELGSISLEFTRLSIITGDMTYYTYVMQLIEAVISSKDEFLIQELYPNEVDLSGCAEIFRDSDIKRLYPDGKLPSGAERVVLVYDVDDDNEIVYCVPNAKKQIKPIDTRRQVFSMEGKSDSFYEYLLKLYILLQGNVDPEYVDFLRNAKDKIKRFLVFTAKVPQGKLRFMNEITVTPRKTAGEFDVQQHNTVSHLSCFAGGFFTLASRAFMDNSDLLLGQELTRSCYKMASRFGLVMPESFSVDSCDDLVECNYDVTERVEYIDHYTNSEKRKGKGKEFVAPQRVEKVIKDSGKRYHVRSSHWIPYAPITTDRTRWDKTTQVAYRVGDTLNQPLEINEMDPRNLLRPELIESLFVNFRITGIELYREQAWDLFEAIMARSAVDVVLGKEVESVQAGIRDVTNGDSGHLDELESWWFAETLKYFYLIFQDSKMLSLDEWVFNTEGHAFKKDKFWLK